MEFVPGLAELKTIISEWNSYTAAKYSSEPTRPVKEPSITIEKAYEKYPAAAAYLLAEEWSNSPNLCKAKLGRETLEKIIHGTKYDEYIDEMNLLWENEVDRVYSELKKLKSK